MKTAFFLGVALLSAGFAPLDPSTVVPPPAAATGHARAILRGEAIVRARCSGCHAVGPRGSSPLASAPVLRDIGLRYPVGNLEEAFAEGVVSAHSVMPRFVLSSAEIHDLIVYLDSLQAAESPEAGKTASPPFDPDQPNR